MSKPRKLSNPVIDELSLVFAAKNGKDWQPVNGEAQVLSVKAKKSSLASSVISSLKAYFASTGDLDGLAGTGSFPVSTDVADNIDHDGDGRDDYNEIAMALSAVYYDIAAACAITDDDARSEAIVTAIDNFLKQLDAFRGDKSEKSGARHSAADKETLGMIAQHHAMMENSMDAIGGALKELGVTAADGPVQGKEGKEQDDAVVGDDGDDGDDVQKAKKKPLGDYGDDDEAGYADPGYQEDKKPRYPLKEDGKYSAERVRAAWSFIHQEKNRELYTAAQLKEIESRIREAAKYVGVELETDKKGQEIDMTQEQIAEIAAKAAQEAVAAVKAEMQTQIEAVKAEAQTQIDAAKAEAEAAAALAATHKAQAEQNAAVLAAVGGTVRGASALSASVAVQKNSRLERVMVAEMKNNPEPTQF